jgi:O-antigen/teichoic acid export membrane protein
MSLLRKGPGVSTEAGRARERYRRVILTAGATLMSRGAQAVLSLVSVPIALGHFGAERYGLWMTVSSLLALLVYVDQGLGYGLVQAISRADGQDDREGQARDVATAVALMCAFAVVLVVAFAAIHPFVPWPYVFNVASPLATGEAGRATIALVVTFAVSAILGIVSRVYQGLQAAFVNNVWQAVGSALALGGLLAAIEAGLGIPAVVVAMVGGPAVASFLSGCVLFGVERRLPLPRPRLVSWERARSLLRKSGLFLGIQAAMALVLAADNVIVARIFGAEVVPSYAVPARLVLFAQLLLGVVPQALWPAYSEALARGDVRWARRAFLRSMTLGLAASCAVVAGLVAFGPVLIRLWVGSAVQAPRALLAGLAAGLVVMTAGAGIAQFLTAAGRLRAVALLSGALVIAAIPLKVWAAREAGLTGIAWAMVAAYAVAFLVPGTVAAAGAWRDLAPRSGVRPGDSGGALA